MREPGITTKLARRFAWSAILLLAIAPQAVEGLELEWLSHQGGTVYSTKLRPGSAELPPTAIATTGYQGFTWGNALSEEGHLYSISRRSPPGSGVWELLDIDLETGIYSQTPLALPVRNLTLDDQGRLWTTHLGALYRLELDGTVVANSVTDENLLAIDSHEGVLYGLVRRPNGETWLIAANPDQGTSTPLVALDGFVGVCGYPESPYSMAFDPEGGLWVNIAEVIFGCITIPGTNNAVLHFPEPTSGLSDPRQRLGPDANFLLVGMAIRTTETVIEVPATGRLGLLVLLSSLALVGTFWLRNRLPRGM